jgi:hypothetical protein
VASILPKTIFLVCAALFGYFSQYGILIFGASQLLYSASLMSIFYLLSENKSLLLQPFTIKDKVAYFDPKSKAALKEFGLVSFLKYVLEKFEQIALFFMNFA